MRTEAIAAQLPEISPGPQWVVPFTAGSMSLRDLLGGKGANVAEMMRVLGADKVPAGFTITTDACVAYMDEGELPEGLTPQLAAALEALEEQAGKRLGDPVDPLLVSVRSGARVSMPGMLDTVLNLGLNDDSVEGLAERTGKPRFAWDCYRRFVQMYGNVVKGVPSALTEAAIAAVKEAKGVRKDTELDVAALQALVARLKRLYVETAGEPFPLDPRRQLDGAIRAVFDSWVGERAVIYRRINGISDRWGTAANVQQMVFGNAGETSGSGVAFSRDELTGAPTPSGDFLANAQGEDVVSGLRNTQDLADLEDWLPDVHSELMAALRKLESHYGDMQDVEFTVEEGQLFLLQTRSAKRPAEAAVRFAVDAVGEGLLDPRAALLTIDADALDALLHPTFDPSVRYAVLARGVAASPGAAQGAIVFTADDAVAAAADGRAVVLVRAFTEAEDIAGFHAARGIVTSEGGKASHAALVARGMGRPAVTGASSLEIDLDAREVRVGEIVLREGDHLAIDGSCGAITMDRVPVIEPQVSEHFLRVLEWADAARVLGVRANADSPGDAALARRFGAQGVGLCRTEHMFLGDRQPLMADVILAEDLDDRIRCLERLRPLQQEDFEGLFEEMTGLPVTVRLLDPPLHEFLPRRTDIEALVERARKERTAEAAALEHLLERVISLEETNPMLGTRGVRLAILYPEIYRMQADALFAAVRATKERSGVAPLLEVMIPLVDYERELAMTRALVLASAEDAGLSLGEDFLVGTMIELPRACFQADVIAGCADFFSFGTNDLTQTALGFSRDDIEGRILDRYLESGIFERSPFEVIDAPGVGQMLRMGAWLGRKTRPDLKLGVCGEHGGDPSSIDFFHHSGVDYVSCSPYRVPVARVAAAQAAIRDLDPASPA